MHRDFDILDQLNREPSSLFPAQANPHATAQPDGRRNRLDTSIGVCHDRTVRGIQVYQVRTIGPNIDLGMSPTHEPIGIGLARKRQAAARISAQGQAARSQGE
jgi:hypothetical protein